MLHRHDRLVRRVSNTALVIGLTLVSTRTFAQAPGEPAPPGVPQPAPEAPPPTTEAPPPSTPPATTTEPVTPPAASTAPENVPPETGIPSAPLKMPTNPEAPLESGPVPMQGKWSPTFYGFVEFDAIEDTTQSLNEFAGNTAIAPDGTYKGDHTRSNFSSRNSRLGFKLSAPETHGVHATAVLEMDFLGNQPAIGAQAGEITENAFITNPAFRMRHYAMKLETDYVDVLLGQYWQLFGWQTLFHVNSVQIQGLPAQVYSRAPQVRFSHKFGLGSASLELAAAVSKPAQRDSGVPDLQAAIKVSLDDWKGLNTAGAGAAATEESPLSLGVSAIGRRFRVPVFEANPTDALTKNAGGISVDALLPILRGSLKNRANALTLKGSFVTGSGINDLYSGLTGGVTFPTLPNPTNASPAPVFRPGLDNGLATFEVNGDSQTLHTINWMTFIVGAQYYLPPSGKLWLSANFSYANSNNAADFVSDAGKSAIFRKSYFFDGCLLWDALPAVRFGLEYAYFHQTYADGKDAHNNRFQFSGFYLF